MKKPGSGSGARALHTKVKKKSGLKESSRRWIERHINDPYVHKARSEGYRSRAAFKLTEIDDRHKLLKPGQRVVDLGAAPGGWLQVAAARTKSTETDIRVVGIDYLDMDPIEGVVLLKKDFNDPDAPEERRTADALRHRDELGGDRLAGSGREEPQRHRLAAERLRREQRRGRQPDR